MESSLENLVIQNNIFEKTEHPDGFDSIYLLMNFDYVNTDHFKLINNEYINYEHFLISVKGSDITYIKETLIE